MSADRRSPFSIARVLWGVCLAGLWFTAPALGASAAWGQGVEASTPTQAEAGVAAEGQAPRDKATPQALTLDKVVVIGASVSAGYGNHNELGVTKNPKLGVYLRHVLGDALGKGQVVDLASSRFFTSPKSQGARQIERAVAEAPTLVVGVDFLFWYANGHPRRGTPRRMDGIRDGLRALEAIQAPLIIGDLPNVDHALRGSSPWRGGGAILRRSQLLTEAERARCNAMIYAWAAERPNVRVFPLAGLLQPMIARKPMSLRGNHWQTVDLSEALQPDLLHPKVRGMIWVALHVGDEIARWSGMDAERFRWKEASVRASLWKALEPEREERRAKDLAREQRRKAREAKRREQSAESEPAPEQSRESQ